MLHEEERRNKAYIDCLWKNFLLCLGTLTSLNHTHSPRLDHFFNTPPWSNFSIFIFFIPNKLHSFIKISIRRPFVNKSARFPAEGTSCSSEIVFLSVTFSQMKWCLISMCLDFSWFTGFFDRAIAPALSLSNWSRLTPQTQSNIFQQGSQPHCLLGCIGRHHIFCFCGG